MATVLTLAQWNQILTNVTKSGCGTPPQVTPPHLWSVTDIKNVQNICTSGPNSGTYTTPAGPPYLWKQTIIDEINQALAKGCCKACNSCGFTGQTTTTFLQSVSIAGCHQTGTSPCDSGTYYNSPMAQVVTYAANAGNSYQQ